MGTKKFDQIIGYTAIKKELRQIADTLKNGEVYAKLGVSAPRGLLLHGEPGVGKSLMASAIIEESGRKTFTCRKDQPNGEFVKVIKATFDRAVENAPSIVFLDDMDKFANGDESHRDAEEYVTVQSCIDESKGKDVFVLATANDTHCLPHSLLRAGRFDRVLEIEAPHGEDAVKITEHYLKSKKVVDGVDAKTVARIMDGHSCAELETVINEAGLYAGYERAESITMGHFMKACLHTVFHVPAETCDGDDEDGFDTLSDGNKAGSQLVYHEAGHAVVHEVLCPESVTLVYVHNSARRNGGFTTCYNSGSYAPLYSEKAHIIGALGGIAAVEQKYGISDVGGGHDLDLAFQGAKELVESKCISGLHLHQLNEFEDSEHLKYEQERAVSAEIESCFRKAKEILSLNRDFLERVAVALSQKHLLTTADIQEIKCEYVIVPVSL